MDHKAEGWWWLHPHLRPDGWVDHSEGSKKAESKNYKALPQQRKGGGREYLTFRVQDPINQESDENKEGNRSNGSNTEDPMQYLFQQLSM
jgi:hypothetical protein